MTIDDLKPCPFCGGEAELPDGPYGSPVHVYEAKCTACYALGAQRDTKAAAREAWNRRPAEAEAARLRAAIGEALRLAGIYAGVAAHNAEAEPETAGDAWRTAAEATARDLRQALVGAR